MIGIFGCASRVFQEVALRVPNFQPKSILDWGSGPGTVIRAATTLWPSIESIVAVEPSEAMQLASKQLNKCVCVCSHMCARVYVFLLLCSATSHIFYAIFSVTLTVFDGSVILWPTITINTT